ncbi:MAG: hypothetical protein IJC92_05490 [Bacteroidaceae bacterium]|nr:hypothetical protein [Bacteroidaceae bacterium]
MKKNYIKATVSVVDIIPCNIIAASINERPGSWNEVHGNENRESSGVNQKPCEWGNLWNK